MPNKRANENLRNYSNKRKVPQWMIAREFGVTASTFCVWMRDEFPKDKQEKYKQITDRLATKC